MNFDDEGMTPNPDPNNKGIPQEPQPENTSDIEDELDALQGKKSKIKNIEIMLKKTFKIPEIETVNNNLDNLNDVLDYFEKRTDDIKAELINLLLSNREILQTMKEENAQKSRGEECSGGSSRDIEENK